MKAAFVAVALVLLGGVAGADRVDDLVKNVTASTDYKERLGAIASLAKEGDQRAIAAFIEVLRGDEEKTVRGAAAIGLGKVVTAATPADLKKKAMDALKASSSKKTEKDSFVRKQAKKAYEKLQELDAAGGVSPGTIYVELGPMASHVSSTSPSDGDLTAAMQKTLEKVVRRYAKDWLTDLPADLDLTQVHAYYVDGAVTEILVKQKGGATIVRCKVSLQIATYPSKGALAQLAGGAATSASSSTSDIEAATYDCVNAVIEDLVIKLIPAIDNNKFAGTSGSVSASGSVSGSETGWSKPAATAAAAPASEASGWSPDGWTLLGEDDVDLIDDEVDVNRGKSTWGEVAIVVTGDQVKVNTVELALVGKGHKLQQAEIAQTFNADSSPRIIEVTGKRRAIDKVRLSYKKHTLDGKTRVQVWAR